MGRSLNPKCKPERQQHGWPVYPRAADDTENPKFTAFETARSTFAVSGPSTLPAGLFPSAVPMPSRAYDWKSRLADALTRREKVRKSTPFRTFGLPQGVLFRGGEQDLFCRGYILGAQLGFRPALGNLIGGSISGEFDARQKRRIAVLMEHQRVRA